MAKQNLDLDIPRLCQAMQRARLVLRVPRQNRYDAVREFVGNHWSGEGADKEVPCNLISQYVSIVGRKLISHNPRALLSTWSKKAKPVVNAEEAWVNQEIQKIDLFDTMSEAVQDALFSIGILKVSLASPGDAALSGWTIKAGQPFAECIDLDDFVYDIHCKKLREAGFMGHRYRVPLAVIKNSKLYRGGKDLVGDYDPIYNMEGDERIGLLGRTTLGGDQEEFEDFIDLWEVYVPRHKVVLTLHDDHLTGASAKGDVKGVKGYGKALRIQKWLGPDCGPYHLLGFGRVPGNPMPKAPVQDLYDLHIAINQILRKLIRQAIRQKEVGFVSGSAQEDGMRLIDANDGDLIKVNNPESIVVKTWGGPNQQNYMLFEAMKQLFSWIAGNLDVLGGLSPQGDTATQEKLLSSNSTAGIVEMQQRTEDFASSVIGALCWYWHHHPTQIMRSEYNAPGLQGMSVVRRVHPQGQGVGPGGRRRLSRDHDFDDMEVKVDPYSMPHTTPQQRLQMLQQLVTQVYLPMAQVAQQQGITLDLNAFFQKWGRYNDDPDIEDVLTIQDPPQDKPASSPSSSSPKPAETTRNYVRQQGAAQGPQKSLADQLGSQGIGPPSTNGQQNGTQRS